MAAQLETTEHQSASIAPGSGDQFRARFEQIINMKHELVKLSGKIDWRWIEGEITPLYSDKGRPGIETAS